MDQQTNLHAGGYGQPSVIIFRNLQILQETFGTVVSRAWQRFIQSVLVFAFVLLVLWIATFLYGSFYYSYMPRASFSTPVHYYYRTDCESPDSFLCSYPLANISLMRNKKHVLTLGQPYRISLHLEMPDSPVNQQIGMFMIRTTCFSRGSEPVANSARSARQLLSTTSSHFSILRYHSELLRTLGTLLLLPAYLSGAAEQKQVLEVELFADYTDDPYTPSDTAIIEILSNKVQIYSSHLYIHAHFTGLRYLMFNFPAFSAMVGISSNFVFISILFFLGYMRQILRFDRKPEQIRAHALHSEREHSERNTPEGSTQQMCSTQTRSTNLRQRQNHSHQT